MRAAAQEALRRGCAAIKWQVASWNAGGRRFYERLGAVADEVWVDYGLTGAALEHLARRPRLIARKRGSPCWNCSGRQL